MSVLQAAPTRRLQLHETRKPSTRSLFKAAPTRRLQRDENAEALARHILQSRAYAQVATVYRVPGLDRREPSKPRLRAGCNETGNNIWVHAILQSRAYAQVATALSHKTSALCTDYYVHLNLFECIARSGIQSLTATVSILGREVAPENAPISRHFMFRRGSRLSFSL